MEKNLLVGNGINIQFGGVENYSNSAIMTRAINNIKMGKYNALTENSLSEAEQLETLEGLDKYGELIETDTKAKETLFKSITGQVVILGLAPNNDEHLFLLLNQNQNIKSIVYYYLDPNDVQELPHHIKKPVTFKKVEKLWDSMK